MSCELSEETVFQKAMNFDNRTVARGISQEFAVG
jgi:hypothetical protein